VAGIKPWALGMLNTGSPTELYPTALVFSFKEKRSSEELGNYSVNENTGKKKSHQ
jgi:hypothetical protein